MQNQLFPKPISYYQSTHFSGERALPVIPDLDSNKLTLLGMDEPFHRRIVSQLQCVKFRRFGQLSGQYIIMRGGLIALDRNGAPIKLNTDSDDDWAHTSVFGQLEHYCYSDEFLNQRRYAMENWDKIEVMGSFPIIAERYSVNNYYHFMINLLPMIRIFADTKTTKIGIPMDHIQHPFQRELISATSGDRQIIPFPEMTKVENPTLLHEPFSTDALSWLRDRVGPRARKGKRLIYVARRTLLSGRRHGGVVEDEFFLRFLLLHGFETIDFGSGELSVAEQIVMLDGAKVVMAAHGANLTNIAFAKEGVSVIELLPYYWTYFSVMQIALAVSVTYFGIICQNMTDDMQMLVDPDTLNLALQKALEAAS
jgi:Glycosyltransferase 61